VGFSLLSFTQSTYNAFFFVTLKDWDQRKEQGGRVHGGAAEPGAGAGRDKTGRGVLIPPPAIPGLGSSGRRQLRAGRSIRATTTRHFLTANLFKFLGAAGKRKEIAAAIPAYFPAVPQLYVDVDREKVSQQQVNLSDVYTTMQAFMGGTLVNYFNRFGATVADICGGRRGFAHQHRQTSDRFYVTAGNGNRVPLSAVTTVRRTTGPEFTTRFNEYEGRADSRLWGRPARVPAR